MKNQNFGDNRDLLKFDLVCQIMKKGLVGQFVYVPMLTADIARQEEPQFCRHESTGGAENKELMSFMDKCIINQKRNISQLADFFKECGIKGNIYNQDAFFTDVDRNAYFSGIRQSLLMGSLILVDPDKGLEDKVNNSGNLLFADLKGLYDRMDENSSLMFTQKFPDELHEEFLGKRQAQIKELMPDCQPISLDDLDSIIFILTKNQWLQQRLMQFLGDYVRQYARKDESVG
jgi:hypothetical protein